MSGLIIADTAATDEPASCPTNKSILFEYDTINNLMIENNINLNELINYNFMCYCLFNFKKD